ncbi:uncharacterized protein LOC135937350 [Cloeon dipterum]|uniref:uncharacterized protein LOC135937350 n=1 Tax=Cloeon dipterum TaxID=197152 RepID=UPI00321F99F1
MGPTIQGFFQTIAISWFFGAERFCDFRDFIGEMIGFRPGRIWTVCWVAMLSVFIFYYLQNAPVTYSTYEYPDWAEMLGLCISFSSMVWIPAYAIYYVLCMLIEKTIDEELEDIVKEGEALGRPEGEANLGYFLPPGKGENDKEYAKNICVLVIHFDFKNARNKNLFREGDAQDVKNLQKTFQENRKCNFRSISSPKREVLLELLADQKKLLRFFSSEDDVPSVFVLYILSHGHIDGEIFTDHYENSNKFISFSTTDIFDSLKNLTLFEDCLKIINFGPCRGEFFDTIYSANQEKFDNQNSCRITYQPEMRNLVVFYSTVETTRAIRGVSGTAFIREACKVLDSMKNDEPLLNVFTSIQNQIHNNFKDNYNVKEGVYISQTPEVKMFALNRRFFFAKSSLVSSNSCSSADASRVKVESEFFPWKSDSGANVRHRRAFLLFSEPNDAVNEIRKSLSGNLQFEISERMLSESSLDLYCKEVSELEPDVGCVFTFIIGKLSEKEDTREVCCRFGDEDIAITDILRNFIGPNNDKWIGKPKIFFLIDQEATKTDAGGCMKISWPKNFGVTSTNHSGWLVLVLQNKDKLQLLIEIFKGRELKEGKSLQEMVEKLLISELKDRSLLNSTLHFKLDFPDFPRSFLKPQFLVQSLSEIDSEIVLSFDTIMEKALKGNRIWVLRSVAGAGKTTVLREIAFQLGVLNIQLKILRISLASISNKLISKRGIDEIEFLAGATHNPVKEVVEKWIESGNCVVFLDGFDEIDSKYQGNILKLIKALKHRSIPVWIGTRTHEAKMIEEAVGNAVSAEIEPLTEEQQIEFLQLETNKSRQQCQSFLDNFPSKDILRNPLHLSLVAQSGGKSNLHDVYKQIVELKVKMCLKNRDGLDVTHNKFEKEFDSAMELLETIAFDSICFLPTCETKERLEKVNGYGVATFENDKLTFIHQTFAEFLAAQIIIHDIEENGELESEEEQSLFHEYNLRQCWKFVDLYYCTILRNEEKIKVHREVFLDVARLNPDGFLKKVVQENWTNIFSMLKPFMTFDETKVGHNIFYSRNMKTLESAVKSADEIAAHLIEMDFFECEDQVLESLPVLVEKAAKYNAILFLNKLKEMFPKLLMMIESRKPMISAVVEGHDEILDFLLQNTAQTEPTNEFLLHCSCSYGSIKCVKVLFKHGAREIRDRSLLEVSAESGHLELVKFLLEDKIRERADLEEEWRAYKRAVDRGHTDVAKYLLEMCPNLISLKIQSAQSPLHLAVKREYWELCQWIVNEAGADVTTLIPSGDSKDWSEVENKYANFFLMLQNEVNKKDDRGKTAIHCAAEYGILELVHKLINSGANVREKDNSGWNSFHFACKNLRDNSIEMIQLLLSTDNQLVKEKTRNDQTGLHIFLQSCHREEKTGSDLTGLDIFHQSCHRRDRYQINQFLYVLIEQAEVDAKAVDKEGRTAWSIAVDKNLDCVRHLLKEVIDLGFKNLKGRSHLHLAAEWNDNEALQIWKNLGGDLNIRDQTGSTPMQVAAEKGNFKFVEKIVELGADVNATNDKGETALHIASAKGCWKTVDCLLKKIADVNQRDDKGKTALHHAAANSIKRLDLVQNLVKHGASLTMTDNDGENVLHHAIECIHESIDETEVISNDDVIYWLVYQNCVDLNTRNNTGETLLILASKNFRWKIVSFLLNKDVDVNKQDENGNTAVHYATRSGVLASVLKMIEKGADLCVTDKKGKNALHHALHKHIFDFIFEKNRDLARGKLINGNTILHWAAKYDFVSDSLFSWLKEQNEVDLNARNYLNETALLSACKTTSREFAKQLLSAEEVEIDPIYLEGRTAVHYAAHSGDLNLVRNLFERGADPCVTDKEGKNALHHAIEDYYTLMFIHGKNGDLVKQRLNNGDTTLHLAMKSSRKNYVIEWLVEQQQGKVTPEAGSTLHFLPARRLHDARGAEASEGIKEPASYYSRQMRAATSLEKSSPPT